MRTLKPYPEYRDSGLSWLGQTPTHWEIVRAKRLFHKMSRPSSLGDEVVTCFRDGVVTLRKNRRTTANPIRKPTLLALKAVWSISCGIL